MRRFRNAVGVALGGVVAFVPVSVFAEETSRTLPAAGNALQVFAYTAGAVGLLMLVGALGWLYQQKRGLHWDFQRDASHGNDAHH